MANKVYTSTEQTIMWIDPSVGSGNNFVSFLPASLANGSGWLGDPRDLGAFPNPTRFRWRAKSMCGSAPTVNKTVEVYWMGFDSPEELSTATGLAMGADANLSSGNQLVNDRNRKKNLQWLGAMSVDRAVSGVPFTSSGLCHLFGRYGAPVFWNETGVGLSTRSDASAFTLTPVPEEIQ